MSERQEGFVDKGQRPYKQEDHGTCTLCGKQIKPNERYHNRGGKKTHIKCEIKYGGKKDGADHS